MAPVAAKDNAEIQKAANDNFKVPKADNDNFLKIDKAA